MASITREALNALLAGDAVDVEGEAGHQVKLTDHNWHRPEKRDFADPGTTRKLVLRELTPKDPPSEPDKH